jgi:hypothetical protein
MTSGPMDGWNRPAELSDMDRQPGTHRGVRIRVTCDAGTVLDVDSDALHLMAVFSERGAALEVFGGDVRPASLLPARAPAGVMQMWVTPVWLPDEVSDPDDDDQADDDDEQPDDDRCTCGHPDCGAC